MLSVRGPPAAPCGCVQSLSLSWWREWASCQQLVQIQASGLEYCIVNNEARYAPLLSRASSAAAASTVSCSFQVQFPLLLLIKKSGMQV